MVALGWGFARLWSCARCCRCRFRLLGRFGFSRLHLSLRLRLLTFLLRRAHFDAALQHSAIFNADALRDHVSCQRSFAANITRSLHCRFPCTLPMITTSRAVMLACTPPLRPMVTRLSVRLMVPSIFPSMYSDSEPVTSPLITSERPIVACSTGAVTVLAGA